MRAERGMDHGCVERVAKQLGYGVESVRNWVRQSDIDDGMKAGTTTAEAERIKQLEQEVRELKRANAILKSASVFFATELDRPQR
jgi:transposase-like protein